MLVFSRNFDTFCLPIELIDYVSNMSIDSQELLKSFEHLPPSEKREVASEIIRRAFALDRDPNDDAQLATLYAEFADEDRQLAEEGIEDHQKGLVGEDAR